MIEPPCPPAVRAAISEYIYDPRNSGQSVEVLIDDLSEIVWATIVALSLDHMRRVARLLERVGEREYDPGEDGELRADQ